MQDRQWYEQILGIGQPWFVERVDLQLEQGEVHVHLAHDAEARWCCPECGQACALHDHAAERAWRHLDTCQYLTLLHAAVPRTNCPAHGVRAVQIPWAEPHGRFTALFERLAIEWLKAASQSAVVERLGLSWDEVHTIMERAVKRGLKRRQAQPISHLGVDEKAFRKGHRYVTIVTDLDSGCVLYVAEDRKQKSLDGFWATLDEPQKAAIEGVAIDMWEPYEQSLRAHLPAAEKKIVYDKFHVAKHLGEAVDQVRRAENKQLRATGDERLVGSKYRWLRNRDNMTDQVAALVIGEMQYSLETANEYPRRQRGAAQRSAKQRRQCTCPNGTRANCVRSPLKGRHPRDSLATSCSCSPGNHIKPEAPFQTSGA